MIQGAISSLGKSVHVADGQFDASVPQKRKQPVRPGVKYTKRARFPGQATFDLANDMNQLPFSKSLHKSPHVEGVEPQSSPDISPPCVSCGVTTQHCPCDPLMNELNELQREAHTTMLLQPETRPITQEQLVKEVKGIYAGLVTAEKMCVEIDKQQAATTKKLSAEQLQALIALRRTLLHEHHDFFMASQHPSASPALRRLAEKYSMPARLWQHALNSFLELLRDQMPGSSAHMLEFLGLAYSLLGHLNDHAPSLSTEWADCVKGLDVYRDELRKISIDQEDFGVRSSSSFEKSPETAVDRARANKMKHVLSVCSILTPQDEQQIYWSYYTTSLCNWTNSKAYPYHLSDYVNHHYQTSILSHTGEDRDVYNQNPGYGGLDWCSDFQSISHATDPAAASGSGHANAQSEGEEDDGHNAPSELDDHGPRQPWGAKLSGIAILVLTGWLLVGQVSSLDFNIFVKVFCIVAVLGWE